MLEGAATEVEAVDALQRVVATGAVPIPAALSVAISCGLEGGGSTGAHRRSICQSVRLGGARVVVLGVSVKGLDGWVGKDHLAR